MRPLCSLHHLPSVTLYPALHVSPSLAFGNLISCTSYFQAMGPKLGLTPGPSGTSLGSFMVSPVASGCVAQSWLGSSSPSGHSGAVLGSNLAFHLGLLVIFHPGVPSRPAEGFLSWLDRSVPNRSWPRSCCARWLKPGPCRSL